LFEGSVEWLFEGTAIVARFDACMRATPRSIESKKSTHGSF